MKYLKTFESHSNDGSLDPLRLEYMTNKTTLATPENQEIAIKINKVFLEFVNLLESKGFTKALNPYQDFIPQTFYLHEASRAKLYDYIRLDISTKGGEWRIIYKEAKNYFFFIPPQHSEHSNLEKVSLYDTSKYVGILEDLLEKYDAILPCYSILSGKVTDFAQIQHYFTRDIWYPIAIGLTYMNKTSPSISINSNKKDFKVLVSGILIPEDTDKDHLLEEVAAKANFPSVVIKYLETSRNVDSDTRVREVLHILRGSIKMKKFGF